MIFTGQQTDENARYDHLAGQFWTADDLLDLRRKPQGEGAAIGLKLNGHERFAPQHLDYFTRTQVYQHHSAVSYTHLTLTTTPYV